MTYLLPVVEPVVEPDTTGTEVALGLAIKIWDDLQSDIIAERLQHVKIRKHTRHWEGEGVGDKALDPQYAVEVNRWTADIYRAMEPLMWRVGRKAMQEAAREMVQTGVANVMNARGRGSRKARSALGRVFGSTQGADDALRGVLGPLERVVKDAARRHSGRLMDTIRQMDADGASIGDIQRAIREQIGTRSQWREQLARYLTTALTEGGKEAAYLQAGNLIVKRWNTRQDERVRHSHRRVDGKEVPMGKRFRVGKYWMQRPLDPAGGIEETVNCRCWLSYDINPKMGHVYDEYAG